MKLGLALRRQLARFEGLRGIVAKIENTATMITAALVTTPVLEPMPPTMASRGDRPLDQSSRIRLRMNMW